MRSTTATSPASPRNYEGGPVGIETLSAALVEPRDALEEIVEPFLLQQGFIGRTPRGRVLTLRAYKHLGLTGPGARLPRPRSACSTSRGSTTAATGGKAETAEYPAPGVDFGHSFVAETRSLPQLAPCFVVARAGRRGRHGGSEAVHGSLGGTTNLNDEYLARAVPEDRRPFRRRRHGRPDRATALP